ncbi:MAG: serine/threonine protein kinase [Anaerolineales bacterium]|nr:serine/threonine protein kinase [Anaerolineales bacterium]
MLARLAPALDKAHTEGIIHRDIKPANILFDEDGNPYLSDFGIVKLTHADTTLTGTADTIGTPAYMSLEQARTEKDLDGRSDIYSLVVILFEMLTGEQPYKADTPVGMVVAHIQDPIPHIAEKRADLPATTQKIIDKGLAKDRADRFHTSQELVDALRMLATRIEQGGKETIDAFVTELVDKKRDKSPSTDSNANCCYYFHTRRASNYPH